MDRLLKACKEFALTINIKKTEVMAQDAEIPPSIYIDGSNLSVVDNFKYLRSTISSNMSLDVKINAHIGKSSHSNGQTKQKGLAEHQSNNEYQNQSLSGMCNQHTPLWKWNMDTLC